MKKSFWSKKCSDWTGGDIVKFTAIITAVSYGIMGVVIWWNTIVKTIDYAACLIGDGFRKLRDKITKRDPKED